LAEHTDDQCRDEVDRLVGVGLEAELLYRDLQRNMRHTLEQLKAAPETAPRGLAQ
jgi:hypothetical protein